LSRVYGSRCGLRRIAPRALGKEPRIHQYAPRIGESDAMKALTLVESIKNVLGG